MSDKEWFAVQVASGHEKASASILQDRIVGSDMQDRFGEVLVPVEKVESVTKGRKTQTERKLYPSYIFVEMEMTPETWYLVRNVPKIIGFIGGKTSQPVPLSKKEIGVVLKQIKEREENPRPRVVYEIGERVNIKDGPFSDFIGNVENVNYERSRMTVLVMVFGRPTPVELDFEQVSKS